MTASLRHLFAACAFWLDTRARKLLLWSFRHTDEAEVQHRADLPLSDWIQIHAVHSSCPVVSIPRLIVRTP